MMWRTVVILLFCFACITFAEVNEKHQKEQDLIAFETWFKGLLAERVEELKVVPREVGQAGVDRDAWRGLFATESVEVGDTVLVIPWHLMITLEKIRLENPEFKDVVDQHKLNIQEIFSLYLIYLKYCNPSNNFFAPWVKILPTKFSSILHFTADELSLLKGSFLGSRAVWRQQQSKANYDALAELVFPSLPGKCSPISYDDWRWAESVVDSRMIDLINDGTDNVRFSAIAPYFDMFNHENPVNGQETWGYNSRKMILHAEAGRNHNPSEQLFISYGTKCNDELLEKYGFLIETNDDRCVHIDIYDLIRELDEQITNNEKEGKVDELLQKKKILLMDKAQKSLDYSYQILPNGVTEEVIFAAEILSYEEDATVGQVNLNRVKWLINRVEKMLKGYPTTAEQDDAIMDSPTFQKISKRAQLAIALRKEEKELLGEVLEQYKEVQASILRKQEAATETPAETHATIVKETPKEKEEL